MSQYTIAPASAQPRTPAAAQKTAEPPAPAVSRKAPPAAAPAKATPAKTVPASTAKAPKKPEAPPDKPAERLRGFAAMAPDVQREIASKGGRRAHEKGTAHEFTSEEARRAGRKGGEVVARDRAHMAEIGAKGGSHPKRKAAQRKAAQPVLQ